MMTTRLAPKRVVVQPWQFGFRVNEGHLKVDVGGGDPPAIKFVNQTHFVVQVQFAMPFLVDPRDPGQPLRTLTLPDHVPVECGLLEDAQGWYPYEVQVMLHCGGLDYIEASGGSRPDVDIQR